MTFATRSIIGAAMSAFVATTSTFAQSDPDSQRLRQYQWIETTEVAWKGDARSLSRQLCRYGPDGQVQKVPIGALPEPLHETGEMEEHLREVNALIAAYMVPDRHEIERAHSPQTVSFHPTGAIKTLLFRDYVRPGDQMTLAFDPSGRKITSVHIHTNIGPAKDVVTLWVLMASLPDGTRHVRQTLLTDSRTQLETTTTNSRYRVLGRAR